MRILSLPSIFLAIGLFAQTPPPPWHPQTAPDDTRLPSGKMQKDEILADDYEKSLKDARELARLSDELKTSLEKSDKNVLSLQIIKKAEDIEKLAKRIRDRMKRY